MRIRDFSDRDDPGVSRGSQEADEGDVQIEGHSPNADVLASTYALQLEQQDLIQEAVFVLLHLEGSSGCVHLSIPEGNFNTFLKEREGN
jgi:nuclear pore complex protein Nup98-Nup96